MPFIKTFKNKSRRPRLGRARPRRPRGLEAPAVGPREPLDGRDHRHPPCLCLTDEETDRGIQGDVHSAAERVVRVIYFS